MIEVNSLNQAINHTSPFSWYEIKSLISGDELDYFQTHYPSGGFEHVSRVSKEKSYSFQIKNIVINSIPQPAYLSLPGKWQYFISDLMSRTYLMALSEILNQDITGNSVSIGFYRFDVDDRVSKHIDKENKLVTQLFYFNKHWESNFGGKLLLYSSEREANPAYSIMPNTNSSVILPRTKNAWHEVSDIHSSALSYRKSLQLEIWK